MMYYLTYFNHTSPQLLSNLAIHNTSNFHTVLWLEVCDLIIITKLASSLLRGKSPPHKMSWIGH